jgi:holo-[acyl-carrier protein] synthase
VRGPAPGGPVRGVGIDAVDVARLRRVLDRRPRIAERVFTDAERAYASAAVDPGPRLAARFAAKEAVAKALGVGIGAVAWKQVEVVRDDRGAPAVLLSGGAADLAAQRGVARWHVSLTHTDTLAVASVVAEGGAAPHRESLARLEADDGASS